MRNLCLVGASLVLLCFGCQPNSRVIEPHIAYAPQPRMFERLPAPFKDLSAKELQQDWGKELYIGKAFARELDLYRALTCFKRALFLIPKELKERRLEIEYDMFLAYYAGGKFQDAVDVFENSQLLADAPLDFSALQDLLTLLYDAYQKINQPEKACRILSIITSSDEEVANGLTLETAVVQPDFLLIEQVAPLHPSGDKVADFVADFQFKAKSVKKAQALNALIPGAGYFYVGQTKSAFTSFVINTLFIAATWQLFERGYIAAGIITASLETGWYFGGINGAGLQAKEYNERLYEALGKEMLVKERLFPILMIQMGF